MADKGKYEFREIRQKPHYDPIGCDHSWPSGFSAWSFVSGSQCGGLTSWEEHISVCMKCGDIRVSGTTVYNHGMEPKHQHHFKVNFSIHLVDKIAAMIRQAAYMNEMTIDEILAEIKRQINLQEVNCG